MKKAIITTKIFEVEMITGEKRTLTYTDKYKKMELMSGIYYDECERSVPSSQYMPDTIDDFGIGLVRSSVKSWSVIKTSTKEVEILNIEGYPTKVVT